MIWLPALSPLAALLAALLTALPNRYVSERNFWFGWWALVIGFLASVAGLVKATQSVEAVRIVLFNSPWAGLPIVELSIDRLAAVMMVVISGIGLLLYRYSIRYLQQDIGQPRYLSLLAFALSALLFMVSAADLVMLFISWQLLSWVLPLLQHNYSHQPTALSALRTFVTLRAGDVFFLCGIVLAYHLYGTVQLPELFARAAADQTQFQLLGGLLELSGATAVTLLIFVGAMSKSAQVPLHMWLPDSLYAPTPIHGLLHAGIINAGGFLLTRLAPLYGLSSSTLHFVFAIGLATTILGTCLMLVQNDIKKTLGYSTMGQMGYMIMECGLGAFSLAVFHLIAHGLFKATIFLNCGDVIHETRQEPRHPRPVRGVSSLSAGGWVLGFVVSLLLPLGITTAAHAVLGIEFLDSQGLMIFLLFSWVTASQAMLTLYRSRETMSAAAQGGLLLAVGVVSTIYLFAAEAFTRFLYPDPGVVAGYLEAAALPFAAFAALAMLFVLVVAISWMSLYRARWSKAEPPSGSLKTALYLFFINRLYLGVFDLRLFGGLKRLGLAVDRSNTALALVAIVALVLSWQAADLTGSTAGALGGLLLAALLLPLFPFHFLYLGALACTPKFAATVLAVILPTVGACMAIVLMPSLSPKLLPAISVLAAFGAVWGSIKALVQVRVSSLLAHGGVALYSVFWWYLAQAGEVTSQAVLYGGALTLANGGMVLGWDLVRMRFGDLDLNRIGGLFRPMPRFALCMALLIMAASGLPPFGLFFGFVGMLLSPATTMSTGLVMIVAAWLAASRYFFQLMRRLLWGPHRGDLRYKDLSGTEVAAFVGVIALLVVLGVVPQNILDAGIHGIANAMEGMW